MKSRLRLVILIQLLILQFGFSQAPSVRLKVKQSSGFLGLGGPRFVELRLSNGLRQQPLNSTNVNGGELYYFECRPAADWKFDPDFVKEALSKLMIEQSSEQLPISSESDIISEGDTSIVLFGFSKSLRIQDPFVFKLQVDEVQNQVQFNVPIDFWPGYETITDLSLKAEKAFAAGRYKEAVSLYNAILTSNTLQIFPQHEESKVRMIQTFQAYLDANSSALRALRDSTQLDPKEKITRIAEYRPAFMYVIDSLPQLRYELAPSDSNVTPLLDQARRLVLQIGSVTDSLQNALDERTVQWILDGSVTGKTGTQYQDIIESLAYAFSSLDFADTNATEIKTTIPARLQARLEKNDLVESYNTFVRVCGERFQMHLTLFPVEFLPNLRKDTAAFPLPFYSMLKAVGDYYAANLAACKEEILRVFRTCYASDLLSRFDNLRVIVNWRLKGVPPNVLRLIGEGVDLQAKDDFVGAIDKFRQSVIIAPDFAYAAFTLGKAYLQSGDSALGISLFQKAYELDTLYLSAYGASYAFYLQRKNYGSMIDVMVQSLARGNDFWETNFLLGQAFMLNGDPERAVNRFGHALQLNPQSYETCIALGKAYQATNDFPGARESFNRAIEIDALRKEAVDALNDLNEQERRAR